MGVFRKLLRLQSLTRFHLEESAVRFPIFVLAIAIVLATVLQVGLGYRATQQWRASAAMVVEQRVDEVDSLLLISLLKDMRGGFESVARFQREDAVSSSPQDLSEIISQTFARFPYIDCFFLWRSSKHGQESTFAFIRTDRPPTWEHPLDTDYSFPVKVIPSSATAVKLTALAREYATKQDPFTFFDAEIGDAHYQVVARIFRDLGRIQNAEGIGAILGFAVDKNWVREKYFAEFTQEMEHLLGNSGATALSLSIVDDRDHLITRTRAGSGSGLSQEKAFPFAFFDASAVPAAALDHMELHRWTVRVSAVDDPLLGAANAGARETGVFILSAALISVIALMVVVRFLRMNIELLAMKSDFVAMVSHELKTPLASISLVGEAMSRGRCRPNQISDYGALLSKEAARLIRLVENLLSVSRITDSKALYSMAPVSTDDLVNEAILRLQTQIEEKQIAIRWHKEDDVPILVCDREAMTQALENIIDNAVRYSDMFTSIDITALRRPGYVSIAIKDTGHGIAPKDLPQIFNKFFRGRNAGLNGSGLGLSIARKIVQDHGGHLSVSSTLGQGTIVNIMLRLPRE